MRTRLKSKATLLFVAFAALLLAVAGTTMALTADPSGNTSPAPTIQSDKADYAPGETVTLTGSGWQPGESVHINVNDAEGQTWSRDVDVSADDSGQIQDQFQLPDWFVAFYKVTATGAQSGVATTTFTDANLKASGTFGGSTTDSYTLTYIRYSGVACGGTARSQDPSTQNITTADFTVPPAGQNSAELFAPATSSQGRLFKNWTDSDGNVVPHTVVPTGPRAGQHRICTDFPASGTDKTYKANYIANQRPVAHPQPLVSTNEDTAKTITLSGTDADGNNLTFAIVSGPTNGTLGSIGTVNCTGTAPKTCSANVTYTPNNNYNGGDSFTFKANDGTGVANSDSLPTGVGINVNAVNDAPSFTKGPDQTVNEDAGLQTVNPWATNISKGPANESTQTLNFSVSNDKNSLFSTQPSVAPNGTLSYTLTPDANGSATVTVTLKDNGGTANGGVDTGASQTFTITVSSVNDNPGNTSVTNNGPVNEGSPATIKVTANDPDGDTLSYEFDCNNDNTFEVGPQAANTAQCTFNDEGTGTYTVNARVTDPNGGTATGSTNVAVKNVNPTIGPLSVTGNSGTACLGSTNVVKLSFSITDPGTADTHSGTINWGDGTTTQFTGSSVTQQHSYSAGTYNITVDAKDNDGGPAVPKSTTGTTQQVSLLYKVSELQDPVNRTGMTMSVFKYGSTVPLKVIITDCNNQPVNGLVPKISFTKVNPATPAIGVNEGLSTQPNDTNFLMRDAGNGQYIYNLSTKSLADGDATYNATITDSKTPATYGPKVSQNFGLRSK